MKSLGRNLRVFGLIFALTLSISAQAQKLWSEVQLSKTSVYVGEPVQVSVRVYTSTWFTEGVDPGNVKVNGAFTVYFRSVSISKTEKGKTFPGVEMIFNVFPFDDENVTFPALEIQVSSPKEGDYKGIPHTVKTKERLIKVKPIPPGFDASQWLVTTNLSVKEQWSGNVKNIKMGDVLERSISRDAVNTVSELIPPAAWDSVPSVSFYPARSNVENHSSKTAISATRTETMRYLFEKEGEITLTEMVFTWWNPVHQKVYKRTLPAITVNVQTNPDLGMLASIKDSLAAQVTAVEKAEEPEPPFTILGLSPKRFAVYLVAILLLGIAFVFLLKWSIRYRKNYLLRYRNSELFYWRKFVRAASSKNPKKIIVAFYQWIDTLGLPEPTAGCFAKKVGDASLLEEVYILEKSFSKSTSHHDINIYHWQRARKMYFSHPKRTMSSTGWINP